MNKLVRETQLVTYHWWREHGKKICWAMTCLHAFVCLFVCVFFFVYIFAYVFFLERGEILGTLLLTSKRECN